MPNRSICCARPTRHATATRPRLTDQLFTTGDSVDGYDLATPNPEFFQRVDDMINLAAQYDQLVVLDPIETGGWLQTLRNNGLTKAFNYGAYLGNRYKNLPNIIWMSGNDFQSWQNETDANLVFAVMQGIHSTDTNHLQTVELSFNVSSSFDSPILSQLSNLNASYTYYPTYAEVLRAYRNSPTQPVFMVEANYEGENDTGQDPILLRFSASKSTGRCFPEPPANCSATITPGSLPLTGRAISIRAASLNSGTQRIPALVSMSQPRSRPEPTWC